MGEAAKPDRIKGSDEELNRAACILHDEIQRNVV